MAAEASLLPLSMSGLLEPSQTSDLLKNDPFLQELFNNPEVVQGDLLTSLLSLPSEVLLRNDCYGSVPSMLQLDPFPILPTSPVGSEGCSTEASSTSHTNMARSPTASITSLAHSMQSGGDSPSESPLMASSDPSRLIPDHTQWSLDNFQVADIPCQELDNMFSASPDIQIDVESLQAAASPADTSFSSSRKAATLLLTDEEKKLLSEEGIALPTDMPLTKAEQKHLKRVRRKIKNKVSAQESRKKKKDYMEGLENRVRMSTEKNQRQAKEMENLRVENWSLMKQLQELQELVVKYIPSKAWTGTTGVLMVLVLSFSLFLVPIIPDRSHNNNQLARARAGHSRNLLFTETDEFGNVIDPNTRKIISVAGGQTPYPLPPWLDQTPVILAWMNTTRLTATARDVPDKVSFPTPALVEENTPSDSTR